MAVCCCCRREFSVETARRSIGRKYGSGEYDWWFPNEDMCADCADMEVRSDMVAGQDAMDPDGINSCEWDD